MALLFNEQIDQDFSPKFLISETKEIFLTSFFLAMVQWHRLKCQRAIVQSVLTTQLTLAKTMINQFVRQIGGVVRAVDWS